MNELTSAGSNKITPMNRVGKFSKSDRKKILKNDMGKDLIEVPSETPFEEETDPLNIPFIEAYHLLFEERFREREKEVALKKERAKTEPEGGKHSFPMNESTALRVVKAIAWGAIVIAASGMGIGVGSFFALLLLGADGDGAMAKMCIYLLLIAIGCGIVFVGSWSIIMIGRWKTDQMEDVKDPKERKK